MARSVSNFPPAMGTPAFFRVATKPKERGNPARGPVGGEVMPGEQHLIVLDIDERVRRSQELLLRDAESPRSMPARVWPAYR